MESTGQTKNNITQATLRLIQKGIFIQHMLDDIRGYLSEFDLPYIELRKITWKYGRAALKFEGGIKGILSELELTGVIKIEQNLQFSRNVYLINE